MAMPAPARDAAVAEVERFCTDRDERWWLYDDAPPAAGVAPLLAELDSDPTGIFWG